MPLPPPPSSLLPRSSALWQHVLPLALFAILWLDLCRQLSYTWDTNEQYAYGWFVPILAVALFIRRWPTRPGSGIRSHKSEVSDQSPDGSGQLSSAREVGGLLHRAAFQRFSISAFVFLLCLLLLPLRVIIEINPDWPLITWPLTAVVVVLTLYAVHLADPSVVRGPWSVVSSPWSVVSPWVLHFAFPICFILVAVQWPYRIEHSLTQNLMQIVASLTVEIIGWFGIPAIQRGNLIEISTGVLGVDEACSGIRSFQSTLMAGLFLGELYLLRWPIRLLLLGAGLMAAFLLNLCRTLLLTWQASAHGISAVDKWHDPAGFTIAIACFGVLWLLAVLIKRKWPQEGQGPQDHGPQNLPREMATRPVESTRYSTGSPISAGPSSVVGASDSDSDSDSALRTPDSGLRTPDSGLRTQDSGLRTQDSGLRTPDSGPKTPSQFQLSTINSQPSTINFVACRRYLVAVGLWSLLCLIATEVWYRSHELRRADTAQWWVSYPTNLPSFQPVTVSKAAAKLLKHDVESGGSWDEPDGTKWTVYCFRWKEGDPTARMSAQAHRPEYCLVGSGHDMIAMSGTQYLPANGIELPFRLYTFGSAERPLHVFFCLWEDGAETQVGFGKTKQGDRLRTVWAGRRGMGQQTFEIICNGYQDMAAAEKAVRERLPGLIRVEQHKDEFAASGGR